ncbi:MAG: hypothetical protein ACRERU_05250 [Methylococcales bacterium]
MTIDQGGTTGKFGFTGIPITLDLKIQVTDGSPGRLYISAGMNLPGGKQFTNELHGWFVPAKLGQEAGDDNPLVYGVPSCRRVLTSPEKDPSRRLRPGSSSWSHCHSHHNPDGA